MTAANATAAPVVSADKTAVPHPVADLSAQDLHRIVLDCKRIGNRARYKLIRTLRTFKQTGLFLKLGFPDIASYGDQVLGYKRSATFEAISVAEKLDDLPQCTDRFTRGDLSWTTLRQIVRVADGETEEKWIEFSSRHSTDQLHIEVQDAVEKNRSTPSEHRYGLPNLKTNLTISLTLAEEEILEKGLSRIAATMGESLGSEQVSTKDVLLFLARRALATESGDALEGRVEKDEPSHTLLYHTCPDCRRSRMATKHGMVEVAPEVVERIEGDARVESIALEEEIESGSVATVDRPNPTRLSRRVKLRDGGICSNPRCVGEACHSHHIVFRSAGGRTAFSNETAVCETCHALIHEGLLRIVGNPHAGLSWSTAVDSLGFDMKEENEFLTRMPVIEAAPVSSAPAGNDLDVVPALTRALVQLGYGREEAGRRIARATHALMAEGGEITEQGILQQALCPNGSRAAIH